MNERRCVSFVDELRNLINIIGRAYPTRLISYWRRSWQTASIIAFDRAARARNAWYTPIDVGQMEMERSEMPDPETDAEDEL